MKNISIIVLEILKLQNIITILSALYFIVLIWIIIFKCNQNNYLYVDYNRSLTLLERLEYGFSKNPVSVVIFSIETGYTVEIFALIFNFIGFIPVGVFLNYFCKKTNAYLFSFLICFSIETFQLFTGYGGPEPFDVIINFLGCFLGILLFEKFIIKINPNSINKLSKILIYIATPLALFCIINTVLNFPG